MVIKEFNRNLVFSPSNNLYDPDPERDGYDPEPERNGDDVDENEMPPGLPNEVPPRLPSLLQICDFLSSKGIVFLRYNMTAFPDGLCDDRTNYSPSLASIDRTKVADISLKLL